MANKITYATKVGLVPKATHSNQWWDDDANEVKTKHNLNDDRITALEAEVGTDTFDVLTLTPQDPNPAHSEGDLFYDGVKKALSVYNEVADITLNLGEELISPIVINKTGATIPNGAVVYIDGISGDYYSIALANSHEKDKCRRIFVATHEIADDANGRVTKIGYNLII